MSDIIIGIIITVFNRNRCPGGAPVLGDMYPGCLRRLLLRAVAVTAAELVHATGGIDQLLLAGEEGVGRRGDFKLHQGIFLAIYFDGLTRCYGRAGDKDFVVRHIFENHLAVVGRMDVFFHLNFLQLN